MRRRALIVALICGALTVPVFQGTATGAPEAGTSADTRPPTQTIFASSSQGVGSLYLLITVHETGKLKVTAKAGSYSFKSVSRSAVQHIPNQVRLKLSGSKLRSARKAIRDGRRLTAVVKSTGTDKAGNRRTYTKRIKLKS